MCNFCRQGPESDPYVPEQEYIEGERYWPPYLWLPVLALVCLFVIAVATGEIT